jgi:hypothetical protein
MEPSDLIAVWRRTVQEGRTGTATMEAVAGLLQKGVTDAAPDLRALAERLGGPPGAIARAAAFLVEDRAEALADASNEDALLLRAGPQAFFHMRRVPGGASRLFSVWVGELRRASTQLGVTAFRSFIGDIAEAAFRALQHGASPEAVLDVASRSFLLDCITSELPGTTDFLAARGMVWLAGALARDDDAARSAIERAAARFRDPEFQSDCTAILEGGVWPPLTGGRGGAAP